MRKEFVLPLALLLFDVLMPRWMLSGERPVVRIDLDQAIRLALEHNPALKAARTQIEQSRAQEITAGIRPNPVLATDYNFLPIFSPSNFSLPVQQNPLPEEFDAGLSFTFERGRKRPARLGAARDQTRVVESQVSDAERVLTLNVAQQFIGVLLAKSNRDFARENLKSFQETLNLSEERFKAGDISKNDLLKIQLQLLQFQTDVSSAELALVQALASLRQLLGYDAVPVDYDVAGELAYQPLRLNREDLQVLALRTRPDLQAAERAVTAAQSSYQLARANGKRDLTTSFTFTHITSVNAADFGLNIEIPLFNRNQGEIARTQVAITQAQENAKGVEQTALTEVSNAYEGFSTNDKVVQIFLSGYRQQAKDSRELSEFAYRHGAASLLDYLDAERSYRATELAYRQALANTMLSLEQLREAVGKRRLP